MCGRLLSWRYVSSFGNGLSLSREPDTTLIHKEHFTNARMLLGQI